MGGGGLWENGDRENASNTNVGSFIGGGTFLFVGIRCIEPPRK